MSFVNFIRSRCKHEKDLVRKRQFGHIEVIQCRKCKEIMSIDTKEFERWVLSRNRSDYVEIDEKNLSKHIASISCVDDLSGLTMKQARAVAMLIEHERLKVLKENVKGKELGVSTKETSDVIASSLSKISDRKKKSLVTDHTIKIDLSGASERVRKEIEEILNSLLVVEPDLKTCENTITCQCGLKHK